MYNYTKNFNNLAKKIFSCFYSSILLLANGQFKQIAAGPSFDELLQLSFAKLLQMKNGGDLTHWR
jgi:hypothetical protein